MNKNMKKAVVSLFAEVLTLLESEEDRMKKVEEFDDAFGVDISGWEDLMKEVIVESDGKYKSEAIQTVNDYYAKYHEYDEDGNPVLVRNRIGNGLHQIVITYDASAPDGHRLSLQEIPDIEAMSHSELQNYLEELQSRLEDLEDDEPEDEDSEDYENWEYEVDQLEELIEEVEERQEKKAGENTETDGDPGEAEELI